MKKSIIFLGLFLVMFRWVIKSNVQASTPIELYDNVWRLINSKYVDQTNKQIPHPVNSTNICLLYIASHALKH